ncbi:MAG: hypothetical protein ACYC63_21225 [Armatimonadota bacterium]|nr:hypothetical protein [Betaproteobacteria bacterium]
MTQDYDRSVEIDILLIFGVFVLIFGMLLFEISAGRLPYNLDSAYGLFLVLISLQIITMGKTPFGDLRRSWALVLVGICAAMLGMFACFIPGVLTEIVRVAVGLVLLGGGLSLLLQLFVTEGKARTWLRAGVVLARLTVACALVYALSVIAGVITLAPGLVATRWTATFLVTYGASFLYLAWTLRRVAILYPPEQVRPTKPAPDSIVRFGLLKDAELPLSLAHLVLMATLLTLLGLLLFPVNLGLLPFSPDGQLGLLLTLMGIQVMTLRDTPQGRLKRPLSMLAVGLIFAALGIVASIVPGLLTNWLRVLLGALNLGSGAKSLLGTYLPTIWGNEGPPRTAPVPAIVKKLNSTQTMLSGLSVAFGLTTLVPGLLPGLLMAGILVVNGLLLLKLASILRNLAASL